MICQTFKNNYQITQISDALKLKNYKKGDFIIKRNDFGDDFFIIEEGEAFATKPIKESKLQIFILINFFLDSADEIVKEYRVGEYFGELALIKNDLRAANVIAKVF